MDTVMTTRAARLEGSPYAAYRLSRHLRAPWRHSLRPELGDSPNVHVVGAAQEAGQAVACTARLRPAALVVDADEPRRRLAPLVRDLHAASPTSRVLLVGDEAPLERTTLLELGDTELGDVVAGYLM